MVKPGLETAVERKARRENMQDSERVEQHIWGPRTSITFGILTMAIILGGYVMATSGIVDRLHAETLYENLPSEVASQYDLNNNRAIEPNEAVKLFQDYTIQER